MAWVEIEDGRSVLVSGPTDGVHPHPDRRGRRPAQGRSVSCRATRWCSPRPTRDRRGVVRRGCARREGHRVRRVPAALRRRPTSTDSSPARPTTARTAPPAPACWPNSGMSWETCDHTLGRFSPDGDYVVALASQFDGPGSPTVSVLDADTGDSLIDFRPANGGFVGVDQVEWEDDDTLLATVTHGGGPGPAPAGDERPRGARGRPVPHRWDAGQPLDRRAPRGWLGCRASRQHGRDGQRRVGRQVERRRGPAAGDHLGAQRGDHGAVVGAQPGPRDPDPDPLRRRRAPRPWPAAGSWRRPHRRSGGRRCRDWPRRRGPCGSARRRRPPGSCAATSSTGTGSPARSRASTQRATAVFRPEKEKSNRCRSRSRREVSPRGKSTCTLLPLAGGPVDVRAAGERQAEQPRHLVERLPRRVVDGGAERVDSARDVVDPEQAGVAAADQHRQARLRQRAVLELVDRDVGGEVVDAVDRLAETERQRLGGGHADQQRPGQSGAVGDGDRVDVVEA